MSTPLWLQVQAPFAAFRWFQTGKFRGTWPIMPPSALWGFILNLACIESEKTPVPLRLCFGLLKEAESGTLYQNVHVYTVGANDKARVAANHGCKSWIQVARREVLSGIDFVVGIHGSAETTERVLKGLAGQLPRTRLPFLGENNYLPDQINILKEPPPATWYTRPSSEPRRTLRLSLSVDHEDSSKTTQVVLMPHTAKEPPNSAWIWVPHEPRS